MRNYIILLWTYITNTIIIIDICSSDSNIATANIIAARTQRVLSK